MELRRHPARGLPAARRPRSTSRASSCAPTCRARRAPRRVARARHRAQLRRPHGARDASTGSFGDQRVRLGTQARAGARASRRFETRVRVAQAAAVVAGDAEPLPRRASRCASAGASVVGYAAAQRHPLDQGRRRAPAAQRQAAGAARRRPARGRPRRRASRSTARAARQIVAQAKELGATVIRAHYPLHPEIHELADRAGPADLVGDPRLRDQDAVPQARGGPQARRARARAEHHRQPEPPVDHAVVDRQRAVGAARARCRRCYIARAVAPGQGAGSRRGRSALAVAGYPVGGLPAAVRAARRHRHQRVLRLVPGPQRPDRRPRRAVGLPRQRARLLSEARRSSSRSSAPRPTATGRSRRRAPTSTSRTS